MWYGSRRRSVLVCRGGQSSPTGCDRLQLFALHDVVLVLSRWCAAVSRWCVADGGASLLGCLAAL